MFCAELVAGIFRIVPSAPSKVTVVPERDTVNKFESDWIVIVLLPGKLNNSACTRFSMVM